MNMKKILSILVTICLICTVFTACSSKSEPTDATTTQPPTEVTDPDDGLSAEKEKDESTTIELKDEQGNTLTLVPVYNADGTKIFAGYIEKAKDKEGKELDGKAYPALKSVIVLDVDEEDNYSIRYTADKKFVSIPALSDEKGYIIAVQDTIDLDGDKDTTEYFKVSTKADASGNLLIKLEADEKGKLINVTVEKANDGKATVTDSTGKKTTATDSTKAPDPNDANKNNNNNNNDSGNNNNSNTNNGDSGNNSGNNDTPEQPAEPEIDYVSIVLKDNGQVSCSDDSNITTEGSIAGGGTSIVIDGAGKYGKYYVTSETGVFGGQLDFNLSTDEQIEVKFYNVNISTQRETAVKFNNKDIVNDKENDGEEAGAGTGQSGTSVTTAAPEVELSFTGTNSFKAGGSGKNGTIYSECKLQIKGRGSAEIDGGQNLSGICSTESIDIKNVTLNITSNAKQGISCDKKVSIESGNIKIQSLGDGIHCNKFEMLESDEGTTPTVSIKSLHQTNCADGIDADEQIIIGAGKLDVTALTPNKYALKVRKVIKGNAKGIFSIGNAEVTASGFANTRVTTSSSQKTISVSGRTATQYTVGNYKSADGAYSFLCSPSSVNSVTNSSGISKTVSWSGNIGTASF
ncbi:MAG: carbohydrate-binding domain-containing protein [Eubacterium sp.]